MKLSVPLHSVFVAGAASAYWLPETLYHVKTCVVPKNETGTDDTPNIVKTTVECGDHSRVVFETGLTYSLWTPLQLKNLSNVEFVFNGNLSLPDNVSYVESVVANTGIYPGRWTNFQGSNVTLTGSEEPHDGWFIGTCLCECMASTTYQTVRTRRAVVAARGCEQREQRATTFLFLEGRVRDPSIQYPQKTEIYAVNSEQDT